MGDALTCCGLCFMSDARPMDTIPLWCLMAFCILGAIDNVPILDLFFPAVYRYPALPPWINAIFHNLWKVGVV